MNKSARFSAALGLALAAGAFWACPAGAVDAQSVREKAEASSDELSSTMTLFFRDAVTAKAIPSAKVSFQGSEALTDASGKVSFPFPEVSDESDVTLYATLHKDGYVPSKVPLLFRLGMLFDYHYSISPSLPPGHLRVVLDWGQEPPDLDAHLVKEGAYHISYRDMQKVEDQARLDHDATTGFGPETITMMQLDPHSSYVYFVHDFTHRDDGSTTALGQSHAHVSVFSDTQLLRSFTVPKGKGNHWTVFFLQDGQIVPASVLGDKPLSAPHPAAGQDSPQ